MNGRAVPGGAAPRRVFVAGATGAVGRVLCRLLVADGWHVTGTTRKPESAQSLEALGVEPAVVDVFDAAALRDAVVGARPAAVVHQLTDLPKAFDPAALAAALDRNAQLREVGTRNLADACLAANVSTLVAQSIAFAYAPGPQPYTEDAPLDVNSANPAAARSARGVATLERLVLGGPFRGVALRYGRLYGPGTWSATPSALGCPVHVDAAADAARRALTRGEAGIYNVAELDGAVTIDRAVHQLGWDPAFRA
ncbi:MAG TPA: NAD-dependent epimerase/dehydratase family protein [Gemmatimonadaceae bacterium]|nr:NAD-dependent epimerase/dehydratase family protein [Gemmatimonadaceae bacterium]